MVVSETTTDGVSGRISPSKATTTSVASVEVINKLPFEGLSTAAPYKRIYTGVAATVPEISGSVTEGPNQAPVVKETYYSLLTVTTISEVKFVPEISTV